MTEAQRATASELEAIRDNLQKVANTLNKVGYTASAYEWQLLQQIKVLAAHCELLASED